MICLQICGCGKVSDDECNPATFGEQCGVDGKYLTCGETSCEDAYGWPCDSHYQINEHNCPESRPKCKRRQDLVGNEIVCLGEIIGSCNVVGFHSCEDQSTEVVCIANELGKLVLSRGSCGNNQRCHEPFTFHAGGCTDFSP